MHNESGKYFLALFNNGYPGPDNLVFIGELSPLGQDLQLILDAQHELLRHDPSTPIATEITAQLSLLIAQTQLDSGLVVHYFGPNQIDTLPPPSTIINFKE